MNEDEYNVFIETMVKTWAFVGKDDDAANKLCNELLEIHLSTRKLQRIPITGDGNCFYRAIEILTNFCGEKNKSFDGSLLRNAIAEHVSDPSVWDKISVYVPGKTQEEFIAEIKKNGKWVDGSVVQYLVPNIIKKTLRVHYFDYNKKIWGLYMFGIRWADPIDLIWHQTVENGTTRGVHYEAAARLGLARVFTGKLEKIESEGSKDCTTLLRNNITANMSSLNDISDSGEISFPTPSDEIEELPTNRPTSAFKPVQWPTSDFWPDSLSAASAPAPRSAASTPSPRSAASAPSPLSTASAPMVKPVPATYIPPYAPFGSKPEKISKQDLIKREMERADRQEQRQDALIDLMVQTQRALVESQQKSDERWATVFASFAMIATGGAVMPAIAAKHTPALAPSATPFLAAPVSTTDRFDRVKDVKNERMKLRIEQLIKSGDLDNAEAVLKRTLKIEEPQTVFSIL